MSSWMQACRRWACRGLWAQVTALVVVAMAACGARDSAGAGDGPEGVGLSASPQTGSITATQQAELTVPDGAGSSGTGLSAAVSADGSTAVVGAAFDTVGSNADQGSVYVFVRSGATWTQQARLTASDGAAGSYLGYAVAVSADGSTAIAGASTDTVGGNANQGSAYVFVRSGATWTQQAKLTASDGAADAHFGDSAAVSADGSTAVFGAAFDTVGSHANQGSAYVFVRSGTTWAQQAELTAADGAAGNLLGYSVAMSGDGGTAVAGSFAHTVGSNPYQGAAYVFERSGTTWTQKAELTAADGAASDTFGYSVAVSVDGTTVVAGAVSGGDQAQGTAYVFARSGVTWTQQAKLLASDGVSDDSFGFSAALSGDGSTAVIGAVGAVIGGNNAQGAAYVFQRSGAAWTQQTKVTASDGGVLDYFGAAVAVSADGTTALVGAELGDPARDAAYVFALTDCACVIIQRGTSGSVADATIAADLPTTNYGSATSWTAADVPAGARQALVRWDLSAIPPDATVTGAKAVFAMTAVNSAPLSVHRVLAPWSEATVTYASFDEAFSPQVETTLPGASPTAANLTTLAQGWVDGTIANDGILIDRSVAGSSSFYSSDASLVGARPKLSVCYCH